MPPVLSPLKALARLSSRGQHGLGLKKYGLVSWRRCPENGRTLERFAQTRSLRSVVRLGNPCIDKLVDADKELCNSFRDSCGSIQSRCFLGCGDGEEGNVLSKTHEERRVVGYVLCFILPILISFPIAKMLVLHVPIMIFLVLFYSQQLALSPRLISLQPFFSLSFFCIKFEEATGFHIL